jgi:hypothetical protein
MTCDVTLAMNDDAMTQAVQLAKRIAMSEGATLPINDARRLRDLVEMMARVIRTEPERHPRTATLDDAARYLRALWPHGSSLTFFAGDEIGGPRVRWSAFNWTGQTVEVARVENEAPSATLARIVERLRAMVEEECNVATDRAARLRAAIGGES